MQTLTDSYLVELAKQMAFLGAFLGGFAATFLATLLVVDSSKRMADWVVGSAAFAACSFIVAVLASVMMTIALNPDAPRNVASESSIGVARVVGGSGFGLGIIALLVSIGLSGWIRSRRTGMVTSSVSCVSLILVFWAIGGFR